MTLSYSHNSNYLDEYKALKKRVSELNEDLKMQESKSDEIQLTAEELNYSMEAIETKIEKCQTGEVRGYTLVISVTVEGSI